MQSAAAPGGATREPLSIQRVSLCDTFGRSFDLSDALQDCIDHAAPFSVLELQPGLYELDRQLVVAKPLTIQTAGDGAALSCVDAPERCAILIAAPDLLADNGLLFVGSTRNVTLEHVVIDGNRAEREASIAARFCLNGRTTAGFNAAILECTNCRLEDVVSRNALCGTGMAWSGRGALIQHSAFVGNGDAASGMWADGLTLLYAPDSEVRLNTLVNNSDVALILGLAARSRIEKNYILQEAQPAFAGIMLHNFGSDDVGFRGDFRDAVVTDNFVDCGTQLCDFGIQAGPRPWDATTRNIIGGDLHQNHVRGAKIGINADGAGTTRAPTRIFGNDVLGVPADAYFPGCPDPIPTGWMNISPTSAIDRHGEHVDTASHLSERCELSFAPLVKSAN